MAILSENNSELHSPPALSCVFQNLETYEDGSTEGWIGYELRLVRGDKEIISCGGTMHDADARALIKICKEANPEEFEPMEPDFKLLLEKNDDEFSVTCFVDLGHPDGRGFYSGSSIGMQFFVTKQQLYAFGDALESERKILADGKEYSL